VLDLLRRLLYIILSLVVIPASIVAVHPAIMTLWNAGYLGGSEGDGGLYVWLAQAFHFNPFQALSLETNSLYPYPLTRAWSDSFLLPSLVIHLLTFAGLKVSEAYNATMFAALTLNGIAVQLLARAIVAPRFAALCAGVLFANSSYIFGNLGHPQLVFFFWVPLSWAFVIASRPTFGAWLLAGLCCASSFYCSVYYAIFSVLGLAGILALRILGRSMPILSVIPAVLGLLLGLLPIAPAAPAYLAVQEAFGTRHLFEAAAFAANGISFLSFSSFNGLFGSTAQWSHAEANLCAGYIVTAAAVAYAGIMAYRTSPKMACVTIALLVAALVSSALGPAGRASSTITGISLWALLLSSAAWAAMRRGIGSIFFGTVAIFFALSLGPSGSHGQAENSFAPLALLWGVVPGLDAIRAVGRYGAVVVMAISIAGPMGAAALSARSAIGSFALGSALVAVTLLENQVPRFPIDPPLPAPKAIKALADRVAADEASVVLPFAAKNDAGEVSWQQLATLNSRYSIWGASRTLKLVNGYSGQRSRLQQDLSVSLLEFPSAEGLDQLSRVCGLRWIVVVPSLYPSWDAALFNQKLLDLSSRVKLVESFPDGSLILELSTHSLVAPDKPVTVLSPSGSLLSLSVKPAGAIAPAQRCTLEALPIQPGGEKASTAADTAELSGQSARTLSLMSSGPRISGAPSAFSLAVTDGCSALVSCAVK
jgi:hypothetical protein